MRKRTKATDRSRRSGQVARSAWGGSANVPHRPLRIEHLQPRLVLAAGAPVVGDVDGSGVFDTTDLVRVFQTGKYRTGQSATYQEGDFNCDGFFDTSDLIFAFQEGNYRLRRQVRDLAAFRVDFDITNETATSGTLNVSGVVKNVGSITFNSGPVPFSASLYEVPIGGGPGKLLASRTFDYLESLDEIFVNYSRPWDATSPREGVKPPTFRLEVQFDPDFDHREVNNAIERSGAEVNEHFGSPTPDPPSRGSNSQLPLPRNMHLADIDGDRIAEWVQTAETQIFAYEADSDTTGMLHEYRTRPIERLITGDFGGLGKDQLATITDDGQLHVFTTNPDNDRLWSWFYQPNFIGADEQYIVGDYNGDARSDILVYDPDDGSMQMYSLEYVAGEPRLVQMPNFSFGGIASHLEPDLQIRAGDVDADGRDDLVFHGRFGHLKYMRSLWDQDEFVNTFQWRWTSATGVIDDDEQIQLARIDDNAGVDLVIQDTNTYDLRFHRLEFNLGFPPPMTESAFFASQLDASPFPGPIVFTNLKGRLGEPGGVHREDTITFQHQDFNNRDFIRRADARWDAANSRYTYWWKFTRLTPQNDQGWAPYENHKWSVVRCKVAGNDLEPHPDGFYESLFVNPANDGVVEYWRDTSYGAWNLSDTEVLPWHTMTETHSDLINLFYSAGHGRGAVSQACVDSVEASGHGFGDSRGIFVIINAAIDSGYSYAGYNLAIQTGPTHSLDHDRNNRLGKPQFGVAVSDSATGTGYIMYSKQSVHDRFASYPPNQFNNDHLIAVRYNGGTWEYNDNDDDGDGVAWRAFNPSWTIDDRLIAGVDFDSDEIGSLQGVAGSIGGLFTGYDSGDLQFFANQFGGVPNPGEFEVTGTAFQSIEHNGFTEHPTFFTHEMGHHYRWNHSYNDLGHEYGDPYDIMSANDVLAFANSHGLNAGPEMNAPNRTQENFIPTHRMPTFDLSVDVNKTYDIAAIDRPEANGALMIRVGTDDANYHTIEFRQADGWDAGIDPDFGDPYRGIIVHQVSETGGTVRPSLITRNGDKHASMRVVGESVSILGNLVIEVDSFNIAANTATVSVYREIEFASSTVPETQDQVFADLGATTQKTERVYVDSTDPAIQSWGEARANRVAAFDSVHRDLVRSSHVLDSLGLSRKTTKSIHDSLPEALDSDLDHGF